MQYADFQYHRFGNDDDCKWVEQRDCKLSTMMWGDLELRLLDLQFDGQACQ